MTIFILLMMITLLNCCGLFKPFFPDAALAGTSISSSPRGTMGHGHHTTVLVISSPDSCDGKLVGHQRVFRFDHMRAMNKNSVRTTRGLGALRNVEIVALSCCIGPFKPSYICEGLFFVTFCIVCLSNLCTFCRQIHHCAKIGGVGGGGQANFGTAKILSLFPQPLPNIANNLSATC